MTLPDLEKIQKILLDINLGYEVKICQSNKHKLKTIKEYYGFFNYQKTSTWDVLFNNEGIA